MLGDEADAPTPMAPLTSAPFDLTLTATTPYVPSFDADGNTAASRKDLWSTISITPSRWLWFSGDYGLQTREGDRIGLAPESSILGSAYDSRLHRYRAEAQARPVQRSESEH